MNIFEREFWNKKKNIFIFSISILFLLLFFLLVLPKNFFLSFLHSLVLPKNFFLSFLHSFVSIDFFYLRIVLLFVIFLLFAFFIIKTTSVTEIKKYDVLTRKLIWNIILVSVSIIIVLFLIWLGKSGYDEYKNNGLNPIEYLKKSFNYIDTTKIQKDTLRVEIINESKDSVTVVAKKGILKITKSNTTNDILDNTSNILGDTSNIITYFTLIFIIISIFVTIGIYQYVTKFKKLEEGVEKADRNVLDSALTTISAVPFIEATQITSSEYYRAIDNITRIVKEKRDIVEEEPKYAPLLVVEALDNWKDGKFNRTIELLEKANDLANKGHKNEIIKKEIVFHLARAYKQKFYQTEDKNYLSKYNKIKDEIDNIYGKIIDISIALIKNENLVKELKKCFEHNNLYEILKDYNNDKIVLSDISKMTAITTILLIKKDLIIKDNKNIKLNNNKVTSLLTNCANKIIPFLEKEIYKFEGINIKTSWYYTIYQIAKNNNTKDIEKYKNLFKSYKDQAALSKIKYIFDCDKLVEADINNFKI